MRQQDDQPFLTTRQGPTYASGRREAPQGLQPGQQAAE